MTGPLVILITLPVVDWYEELLKPEILSRKFCVCSATSP